MATDKQRTSEAEQKAAAIGEIDYFEKYPLSPTAVRRPKLVLRGATRVALLGYALQDGVAGIGITVTVALRAFDVQYLNFLQPRG